MYAASSRTYERYDTLSLLCLLACFGCIGDRWLMSPLLTIWWLGHEVRRYHGDQQVATDTLIFGAIVSWIARKEVADVAATTWSKLRYQPTSPSSILACGTTLTILATLLVFGRLHTRKKSELASLPLNASEWNLAHPKPKIFPCATQHARMFPKRHAFLYSYLQCGFPIIPTATLPSGVEVSDGRDRVLGSWWMRVWADDYLDRGQCELGFYMKLKEFLNKRVRKGTPCSTSFPSC